MITKREAEERDTVAQAEAVSASDAVEVPPVTSELPPLAAKADDLEALRTAVVDAAGVGAGLWISYLFVLFYLLVAAGSVTHQDLFFETPVKLPFLGVDLPLKGFFLLGPALFLIVHAYVLLHFAMLSGKIVAFDTAFRDQIRDLGLRTKLRRQPPSNIFVQLLAGPRDERNGLMGFLLWLIALISLVAGPICLLIFFELQFLPYHNAWITGWQRVAVGIELLLMWACWGRIALREDTAADQDTRRDRILTAAQRPVTYGIMAVLTGGSVVLLVVIATFPGEWLDIGVPRESLLGRMEAWMVAGDVNPASRQPESLWSNRLVLPGLDVIVHLKLDSEAKIDFLPETVSLRERDLRGAVLLDAVLRKGDFTGADLRDAELIGADLRQAKFACGYWANLDQRKREGKASEPKCAQLQGASLDSAQRQGASLFRAQLQGAELYGAKLQGATLDSALRQGTSLAFAQLQGASMRSLFVWRPDGGLATITNAWIEPVEPFQSVPCDDIAIDKACPWTAGTFKQLKDLLTNAIPEGRALQSALKLIESVLNPDPPPFPKDEEIAARWNKANTAHPDPANQEAEIVSHWQSTGCDARSAPHVVAALAQAMNRRGNLFNANSPFAENSPRAAQLAAAFLDPSCAGNKGLSDADTAILKKLAAPLTARPNPPNSAPTNAQGTKP